MTGRNEPLPSSSTSSSSSTSPERSAGVVRQREIRSYERLGNLASRDRPPRPPTPIPGPYRQRLGTIQRWNETHHRYEDLNGYSSILASTDRWRDAMPPPRATQGQGYFDMSQSAYNNLNNQQGAGHWNYQATLWQNQADYNNSLGPYMWQNQRSTYPGYYGNTGHNNPRQANATAGSDHGTLDGRPGPYHWSNYPPSRQRHMEYFATPRSENWIYSDPRLRSHYRYNPETGTSRVNESTRPRSEWRYYPYYWQPQQGNFPTYDWNQSRHDGTPWYNTESVPYPWRSDVGPRLRNTGTNQWQGQSTEQSRNLGSYGSVPRSWNTDRRVSNSDAPSQRAHGTRNRRRRQMTYVPLSSSESETRDPCDAISDPRNNTTSSCYMAESSETNAMNNTTLQSNTEQGVREASAVQTGFGYNTGSNGTEVPGPSGSVPEPDRVSYQGNAVPEPNPVNNTDGVVPGPSRDNYTNTSVQGQSRDAVQGQSGIQNRVPDTTRPSRTQNNNNRSGKSRSSRRRNISHPATNLTHTDTGVTSSVDSAFHALPTNTSSGRASDIDADRNNSQVSSAVSNNNHTVGGFDETQEQGRSTESDDINTRKKLKRHYVSSTPQSVEDNEVPGPSTDEDEDTWNVKVSRQDVRNILNARGYTNTTDPDDPVEKYSEDSYNEDEVASQFTVSVSSENEESGDEVYASFSHLSFSDSDSFIEKYNFALPRHNSPWSSVNGHAPQTSDSHESEASRSTASTQNSSSSSEHASVVNESLSSGSYESIILSPASSFEDMDFVSENRSFVRRPLELPQDIQNRDYYVRFWLAHSEGQSEINLTDYNLSTTIRDMGRYARYDARCRARHASSDGEEEEPCDRKSRKRKNCDSNGPRMSKSENDIDCKRKRFQ